MKVLLIRYHDRSNINSREIKNVIADMGIWPPLGLLYLATVLKKQGYDVEILDVLQRRLDSQSAKKAIFDARADIIGITATTPEVRGVMEAARFGKESGARVIMGGPHLGIFPDETLSFPEVDFAVRGDGENPLLSLLEVLGSSQPNFSSIPGLVYRENGVIYKNEIHVEKDLDRLPFPDWNFVSIRSYSRADALRPLATMISARGCPYRCGFCYRSVNDTQARFRNPISIVDEIEYLIKNWGVQEIIFCNDTLTLRKSQIMAMCEEILRRNIKIFWQGATRVDAVDAEMLKLMKKAGCKQLKFGIESGNEEILKLMNKELDKDKAAKIFLQCKKEKIRTGAYFIIGYVDENEHTIQETINFAKALDPDFAMFYAGVPLPDTSFHELAVDRKNIDPDYWRDYVLGKRDDKIGYMISDMDKWIRWAFRQFYGRPLFIAKKLLKPDLWLEVMRNPSLIAKLFFAKNE